MISCRFIVSHETLSKLEIFFDENEISNVSFFENAELGFSDDLDENGFPIAKFFDVEIFVKEQDDAENLRNLLEAQFGEDIQQFEIRSVEEKDWVDSYIKELKPIELGDFYFYNESIQDAPENQNLIPIKLNSALAFGSGHHQTTQACLLNLMFLKEQGFAPEGILDMGCGTGILGICALKVWKKAKLLGIDIDPDAIKITLDNFRSNNTIGEAFVGCDLKDVQNQFDLVFCNILKQPLLDLADSFYDVCASGGYIITSGFIKSQEEEVISRYESLGFEISNRIAIDEWLSIMFKKCDA